MATSPALRILNVSEVLADLDHLGEASDDLSEAFEWIAGDVAEQAAERVHVLTARLRDTITAETGPNRAIVTAGSESVTYAGIVNYRNPGDEFLTGPANTNTEEKSRKIADALEALIRRFGLK